MATQKPVQKQVQIKAADEHLKGFYSNFMQINHTKEEVVLDFMNILGAHGILGSRVIVSPAHAKRITQALAGALKKYESQFGTINEGESPANPEFGFKTQSS